MGKVMAVKRLCPCCVQVMSMRCLLLKYLIISSRSRMSMLSMQKQRCNENSRW